MRIKPIGERVLIKPKTEERTRSGIYLPESAQEGRKEGVVVAVGSKDDKPLPLHEGDVVLYGGYSNDEFEVDGEAYIIVDFKDILAKVD